MAGVELAWSQSCCPLFSEQATRANPVRLGADRSHWRRRDEPIFSTDRGHSVETRCGSKPLAATGRTHSGRRSKPLAVTERTHFSIGPKSPPATNATVIGIDTSAILSGAHPPDPGTLRGWERSHFRDRSDPRCGSKPFVMSERTHPCRRGSKPSVARERTHFSPGDARRLREAARSGPRRDIDLD
jgi:hypothetical protein